MPTPFSENPNDTKISHNLSVSLNGKNYKATYVVGRLDTTKNKPDAEDVYGWPYPFKQYYRGSFARSGVTIISRGKVLRTGVFSDIWRNINPDVSYNNWLAELHLDENFPTVNQKDNVNTNSEQYQAIIEELVEKHKPISTSRKEDEETLRQKIIKQLENADITKSLSPISKKKVPKSRIFANFFNRKNLQILNVERCEGM